MAEQRDLRRVVAGALTLVEEEQQAVLGRERRGAGADAERTFRGPDERVLVEVTQVLIPVVGRWLAELVERVEEGELDV